MPRSWEKCEKKTGTLKNEANSLDRMLTRRVANPHREAGVRAKMRRSKMKRGAFKQKLKHWGDLVTFDYFPPERVGQSGIETCVKNLYVIDQLTPSCPSTTFVFLLRSWTERARGQIRMVTTLKDHKFLWGRMLTADARQQGMTSTRAHRDL